MQKASDSWSIEQSKDLYSINHWGGDYFGVNPQGNISVTPTPGEGAASIDLFEVVEEARNRGLPFPLLVRFQDLLRNQVKRINECFNTAIRDSAYQGQYRGVFPIKVNQLREVVEEIKEAGREYHYGLEVGSKPELFAALAIHEDQESLLICNGYKDSEFIRIALTGRKLNKKVIMVVEKIEELRRILDLAEQMGVEPYIGIRVRLQTKSSGKWALSGGEEAKFGLSTADLLEAAELLKERKLSHCFQLIHFHVGSQIPDILTVKKAVREATRYYAKLRKLGFDIGYLDVGGGLGVDYNGTRSGSESSTNYTLAEYTRDVVHNIADVCSEESVPHPNIVSESGRAVVAHHSVLVVEVFGTIEKTKHHFQDVQETDHKLVRELHEVMKKLNKRNRRESLHQAQQIKDEANSRFELGLLDLDAKAKIESGFWKLCETIQDLFHGSKSIPKEVQELSTQLSEQYLCNFSVFQSLIDHWAVGQLFPIAPIHRLHEEPLHQATLVDITCDSDGKIDEFIQDENIRSTLPLHDYKPSQPYLLGFFLMGAYQDVMGDLHNLFGPVTEAHVFMDEDENSGFYIEDVIPGYTIGQVLGDVQYEPSQLARLLKAQIDAAIKKDLLKPNEGMRLLEDYEKGMSKSTYLSL
ncbi:MAG: biosynthetic arginine decarboxylase [Blastochloris sp.]|nr:biosynthetic arginine decarboxylase [Blastochloris sp.]